MKLYKILSLVLIVLLLNSGCNNEAPNIDGYWLGNFDADNLEDLVNIKNDTIFILSTEQSGIIKYPFKLIDNENITINDYETKFKVEKGNLLRFYDENSTESFHAMKEEVYTVFYNRYLDYYNQSFDEMPVIDINSEDYQ